MNDRMAELFGQAGISDSINEEFGIEYLAELIIKECTCAAEAGWLKFCDEGVSATFPVGEVILEHFGVE